MGTEGTETLKQLEVSLQNIANHIIEKLNERHLIALTLSTN